MDYKYQGIILSKFDAAEVDRIYSIYTREAGKIKVLGKGVRNPNAKLAGQLESVTHGEIFVAKTKGRGKITGAIAINNFPAVKSNFQALSRVFYIFGILEKMISAEEKDEGIFNLLVGYLEVMEKLYSSGGKEETKNKADILTGGFLFKFLDYMGYKIDAQRCIRCQNKLKDSKNYFDAQSGGFICEECRKNNGKGIKSTSGAIKIIRLYLKNNIENFTKIKAPSEDIKNSRAIAEEMLRWV